MTTGRQIECEVAETQEEGLRLRGGGESLQLGLRERRVGEEERGHVEQLVDSLVEIEEVGSVDVGAGGERARRSTSDGSCSPRRRCGRRASRRERT